MAETAESFPTAFCHNLSAQRPPTGNDDVSQGYRVGSRWVQVGVGEFVCVDPTFGKAKWVSTNASQVWYRPL